MPTKLKKGPIVVNIGHALTSLGMTQAKDKDIRLIGNYGSVGNLLGYGVGLGAHLLNKKSVKHSDALNFSTAMGLAGNAYGAYKAQKS